MKVLHVDDSSEDRELIRYRLQKLDDEMEIVWADNADSALELAQTGNYDCILSDYQMPNTNGLTFLRNLRNTGINTPFIFLTGHGNEGIAATAFKAGADDYYTKELEISHYERILNSIKNLTTARKHVDITQRFRKQLDETNERFMVFTEASQDGLIIHSKGCITLVNSALTKMMNCDAHQLIGVNILDIFPDSEKEKIRKHVECDFDQPYRTKIQRNDGSVFQACIQGKYIRSSDIHYRVAVVKNIEEIVGLENTHKHAEKLAEHHLSLIRALPAKLLTPARLLQSFSDILSSNNAVYTPEQNSALGIEMEKLSETLIRFSEDLSDYLFIASCRIEPSRINLSELAHETLHSLSCSLGKMPRKADIENNIFVEADPRLMEIAVKNLFDNVKKFQPDNNDLELHFGSINIDGENVLFLRDNGLGFEIQEEKEIYRPFNKLHNKTLFQGTGMGLTKVKLIVEKHGGRIWAESTPNQGTTFYFTLSNSQNHT